MQPGYARVVEHDVTALAAPHCGDLMSQRHDVSAVLDAQEWYVHCGPSRLSVPLVMSHLLVTLVKPCRKPRPARLRRRAGKLPEDRQEARRCRLSRASTVPRRPARSSSISWAGDVACSRT